MPITVIPDSDVRLCLGELMQKRGISFQQALNDTLRAGLGLRRRFVQKTYSMGAARHFRWDKALAAAGMIEDEDVARKPIY